MKSISKRVFVPVLFSFVLFGCAHDAIRPVHDEVVTVSLPMDLTYLKTLEAVQKHPDWEIDYTEKEQGLIHLRNLRYSSFADADLRTATLVLKRIGPRETSVQLAPKSQTVVGGDEILKLIKEARPQEGGQN